MSAIEIKNLTKSYGELVAVSDLSFEVHEGEIYGLLGPNGAGKSTTLKVMMGLLKPDKGTTKIFGIDSQEDPVGAKSLVGYAPEEKSLYESLTARELFEFVASVRNIPEQRCNQRLEEMVKALDFQEHVDKMIVTLSAGNKQKALLISIMLHAPKLLILDEPFSGLDVRTARIMKEVVKIHTQNGGSVLLSTHIMEVAEGLCDRIGIIDDGKLVGQGTMTELRTQAKEESATLEQLFLRLTGQEDEVEIGIDSLKEALQE
ncbi:MAG: ATP-binding cassette domain-containing protein [Candidatus Lokiarchaeota archaeon]|nr:ATP-binding cassette domain-containing protein [Candidatus Lokiarchaeota archaeon]